MASGTRYQGRCPHCGVAVKEVNLARHLRSVHPSNPEALRRARELEAAAKRSKPRASRPRYGGGFALGTTGKVLALVTIVVAAGAGAAYYYVQRPNPNLTKPILDICYGSEQLVMHRHAFLNFSLNGNMRVAPDGAGIPKTVGGRDPENCWRPLHTHLDDSGRVHIESDVKRDWTLGEFLQVWDHDFVNANVEVAPDHLSFGTEFKPIPGAAGNATLNVTVDGKKVNQYDTLVMAPTSEGIFDATAPVHHISIVYRGP